MHAFLQPLQIVLPLFLYRRGSGLSLLPKTLPIPPCVRIEKRAFVDNRCKQLLSFFLFSLEAFVLFLLYSCSFAGAERPPLLARSLGATVELMTDPFSPVWFRVRASPSLHDRL